MTKLIYPFSSKKIPTLSEVGGKGLSLILTAQEGLPVPDGFVLTMEFFKEWLQAVERSGEWRSASNASTENRKQHFDEVKEKALGFSFSDVQKNELAKAMKIFGEHLMAVRSSSPEEDLEGSSFAGGYETVLGVTEKTLEKSIKTAFVSCLDERIFVYKKEQGFSTEKPSIAVIIQQQIASDVSGVAFSLNPQNNCYDEAVINSNFGLGETIVAGQVTPDTFIVDMPKKEILEKKIANKSHALWLKKNGGTEKKDNENPEKPSLTDKQAKEVAQLAGDAEKFFEKPMDIEWAFENKKLYLLQARPITTYLPLFPEMITKPGERKNIYMDIIVLTQGFSEPFSVLGLDIWAKMLEIAKGPTMIRGLDGIVFDIHGRQYLHMSNMMKAGGGLVKKMMTAYDVPTRKIFEAIDTKEYTPEETPEKLKGYLWGFIKYMGKMFPAMLSGWLHPDRAFEAYFKESDRMWKYLKKDLPKENKTFDTLVKNGLSVFGSIVEAAGGMITIIIGPLVLKRIFKNEEEATDLLVALNMDLPGNPTSEMGHLMLKIASFTEFQNTTNAEEFINNLKSKKYSKEFLKTYKEYIDRFGCRGMKEIDIATPRPYENLETIFNQLKQININDNAIKNVKKRKEESYAKLLKIAKKIGKEKKFARYAKAINDTAGIREHPKYIYVAVVDALRKHALKIGKQFVKQGRLENENQIFDLHIAQVAKAQRNPKLKLLPIIEKNLAPYKTVENFKDWPRILDSRGKIFRPKREGGEGLLGDAISPGVIQGRAKVLHSPYEKPINKGEILVARMTEPSWTPIFINAAGVVLEVGGSLQHGAIIAREYGIPCVSGVEGATQSIKDGQLIEVDGSNGLVRIINEDNPYMGQKADWTLDDPKDILVRSSIVELMPDPLTPLFETIATKPITKGLDELVRDLMKSNMFKDMDFKFTVLSGYGYYSMKIKLWTYIKMIPTIFRIMPWMFKESIRDWQENRTPKFKVFIDEWKKKDIKKMSHAELLEGGSALTGETMKFYTIIQANLPLIYMGEATFIKYYDKLVKRKNDPPSQTFMLGYDSLPILADKSLFDMALGIRKDKELATLILNSPLEEVLDKHKQFKKKFQAHLDAYGHMIYDLDVAKAVAADSPEPILETLKFYVRDEGVSPYRRQEKMIKEREVATKKIQDRLGFIRRPLFNKLLKFAQNRAPLREDGLADVGLAYPTARAVFLELGQRMVTQAIIEDKADIFWLKKDEVNRVSKSMDAGKKVNNIQGKVEDRKKLWEWQRSMTPPPFLPKDASVMGFKMKWYFPGHVNKGEVKIIKGLPASKGITTGIARVILGPEDFDQMQPGDILVTAITTPAWTPLFALASAVVTDIGGPLSHSSIVAREYGVPAVLGTEIASRQIKSGQLITVDGDTGNVTLH